ncbi:sodium/pantothenate symporter [Desulfotalea psychrophila]|uniref:Probable sodium/pantothenate symporter n=1 Tax=Desulfotalea psychrophila (strain LSv54 / DSM 12343) TaxID=177439 RepID=Q6AR35_DESPS|nr:probable sodium/pantothenate symporter [Desulfotalea psychrophila LSv54]
MISVNPILVSIVIYLVLTLLVSRFAANRAGGDEDFSRKYFLGGQFMGGGVLALSLVATYTSASSFIGGPGAAYTFGLGWVLLAVIQVPVVMLTLGVLGPRLWTLAKESKAVTILDIFRDRYHSKALLWLAGMSLVAGFLGMIVVQFTSGARLLNVMVGMSYANGLFLFVGTVVVYTLWGGFRAVSYTDAIQGLIMLAGMVALLLGVLAHGGGMANLTSQMASIDPGLVQPHGAGGFMSWPFLFSFWILVCFGTIGLPHTVLRVMAAKDGKAIARAMVLGTAVTALVTFLPHLIGALGRPLVPELSSPDEIMPTLMLRLFSPWVAGLLLAAPIAAIMSSVDSMLLQATSTLVNDLAIRNYSLSEGQQKWLTRVITIVVAGVCTLLALNPPQMIIWLNMAAFGALQVVFLWPLVLGLFWPAASSQAALASMVLGLAFYLPQTFLKIKIFGLHAIVSSLLASLLAFLLVQVICAGKKRE